MKKITTLTTSLIFLIFSCHSQTSDNKSISGLMKHIKKDYVDLITHTATRDSIKHNFVIPYYEFSVSDIKVGDACLFAISKDYPQTWVNNAIKFPKGDCNVRDGYKDSFYIKCEARRLFGSDTLSVQNNFDIFLFFVDKKELSGPFIEIAEGGSSEHYTPKKGSTILVYKFDNGQWMEFEHEKYTSDDNLRVIGTRFAKKIAEKRIEDYLIK